MLGYPEGLQVKYRNIKDYIFYKGDENIKPKLKLNLMTNAELVPGNT